MRITRTIFPLLVFVLGLGACGGGLLSPSAIPPPTTLAVFADRESGLRRPDIRHSTLAVLIPRHSAACYCFGAGFANTSSATGALIFTSVNLSVVTEFQVACRTVFDTLMPATSR